MVQELIERSQEAPILHFTPNDAARRFKTLESTEAWLSDESRTVYTLDDGQTAGMIWYTETLREDLDARYTFGIRMERTLVARSLLKGLCEQYMRILQKLHIAHACG